jgi:hypothetical protein
MLEAEDFSSLVGVTVGAVVVATTSGTNKWHRNSGGSSGASDALTSRCVVNSGHHPRPDHADHRNNNRAKHGNSNSKVETPFVKEAFLHMLESNHAKEARQSSDDLTSCTMCGNPDLSHVRCKRVCLIRHIASPSRYKAFLLGWLLVFWLVEDSSSRHHWPCGREFPQ